MRFRSFQAGLKWRRRPRKAASSHGNPSQSIPQSTAQSIEDVEDALGKLPQLRHGSRATFIGNLLQRCTAPEHLSIGRAVHQQIARSGDARDRFVQNLLIQMYGKCGAVQEARKIFDAIADKNVFSWNIMIGAYVNNGLDDHALDLYKRMAPALPSAVTFVSVLEACSSLVDVNSLHGRIKELGLETNPVVATALINAFSAAGSLLSAEEAFHCVDCKDAVCWTSMITAFARNGDGIGALKTFSRMNLEGIFPDEICIVSVITACSLLRSLLLAHRLYKSVVRAMDCLYHVEVGAALVNMFAKCGSLADAWKVFDRSYKDDVVLWNTMISVYADYGENHKALTLYREGMRKEFDMAPDAVTFVVLLEVCTNLKDLKQGTLVHKDAVGEGLDRDPVVANAVVNMYGKCGELQHARKVFDLRSDKQRVVSWNGMMALYLQHGQGEKALELYKTMSVEADELTYVTLLAACGSVGDVEEGRRAHAKITASGFEAVPVVANSLLSMYSKFGRCDEAKVVFEKIQRKEIGAFNSMISALTEHGKFEEALGFFPLMDIDGVRPNDVTFINVFLACSHAGLVDKAWELFLCMVEECGIEPSEKHCGCVVDLLGRAGKLEEAEKFIANMEARPGAVIWMTLLGACKLHGDVDRGRFAAEKAIEIDPADSGPYVALASIFMAAGMKDEADKLRKRLSEQQRRLKQSQIREQGVEFTREEG
ncbi:pentatricopeptide repeat-containing protein At3g53360, mitochondrial [Selaginella moellendorffii]|uniref:pentatricopeptide repeat-containing protein At3g53360, mitochondrial n=1 Tax=Selaginella moellendorffii TaxID=88036 RepID=UPI000D1C7216|nr:pentatricopeptide repeat-containing protein At3g53360, mitochondrial [Selaginella moellendorffii]|eukprot:XP_024538379.1 pentatricopeptide repeat-containing protein At3g53360, mitochondrial [Selaginella moellendorffii]